MTRFGIEVSRDKSVEETDIKDFLYTSDFPSPKVARILSGSFTTDSSGVAEVVLSHGLFYSPAVFAYIKRPDGNWYSVDNTNITAETSRSSVKLVVNTNNALVANTKYNFKIYVFSDPAQDPST